MSTETAVQVVWWIGLVAALGLTVVAVKLLSELLRTLGQLRDLAGWIATAADGMAGAFSGPLRLTDASEAAEGLRTGATAVRDAAERVRSAANGERLHGRPRERETDVTGGAGAGELGGAAGGPGSGGGAE